MVRFCRIDSFSAVSGRKRLDQRSSSSSSSAAGANRRRAFQARDVLCREETELLLSDEEAANGSPGPPMSRPPTDREGKGEFCSLTITDETAKRHPATTTTTTDNDDDGDDDDPAKRRRRHHRRHHHRHSIPSQLPAQTLEELNVRSLTRLPFPVSAAATTSGTSNSKNFLPLRNCFLSNKTSTSAVPVPVRPNCSPLKSGTLPEDGVGMTKVKVGPEQQHRNSDRPDSTGNDAGWRNVDWLNTTRLSPQPNRTSSSSVSPWNPSITCIPTAAAPAPPPNPPSPTGHVENSRMT